MTVKIETVLCVVSSCRRLFTNITIKNKRNIIPLIELPLKINAFSKVITPLQVQPLLYTFLLIFYPSQAFLCNSVVFFKFYSNSKAYSIQYTYFNPLLIPISQKNIKHSLNALCFFKTDISLFSFL